MSAETIASATVDAAIRIWDINIGSLVKILPGHKGSINSLAVLAKDILASGSTDTTIKLWNLTNGVLIRSLVEQTKESSRILSVASLGNDKHESRRWIYSNMELENSGNKESHEKAY